MEQHSTVSSCLIRLNQVFIDLLASQQRLNHVFKSFVSIMQSREEVSLTRLHSKDKWKLALAHQQEMLFLYPFYLELRYVYTWASSYKGLGPRMSVVSRYLTFCYLGNYLSNCSYNDVPSSFLSLHICCQQFESQLADVDDF